MDLSSLLSRRAWQLAISALAALLVACGRESVRAHPPPDAVLWKVGAWRPASRPFPLYQRELAVVDVPWAADPGPDEAPPRPVLRFTVNLQLDSARGSSIYFKGERWPLDGESRSQALDALRNSVARLLRRPSSPDLRPEILLRATYKLPWADVRDVLHLLGDPVLALRRISFAVASSDPSEWREARIDADLADGPAPATAPLALAWSMADGPTLEIGGGSMVLGFPAGEPYAASAVEPSNTQWRRLLGALTQAHAAGTGAFALRIDPRVPWAHVAQTLGLLVARGRYEVSIDGGPGWRLSTPDRSPARLGGPGRELVDIPPAVAVGIGVGLALSLFGLWAFTSRRRRRRPVAGCAMG